nr:fatty acid 2-hydroxylase [Pogona vitticeps]
MTRIQQESRFRDQSIPTFRGFKWIFLAPSADSLTSDRGTLWRPKDLAHIRRNWKRSKMISCVPPETFGTVPGAEVLRERAGTDVRAALDGPPHRHSENARRWLEQYRVGWLDGPSQDGLETSTSDSYAAATTADTTDLKCKMMDADTDLVDWSKPLLWQVGHLREKYDEWIHQPVDRPIRLFQSELIESLSKTAWYMVCVVWIPVVLGFSWYSYTSLAQGETRLFSSFTTAYSIHIHKYYFPVLFIVGMCVWSFLEYLIHRFIFHMKPPASNYYLITLHFILHGQHHKLFAVIRGTLQNRKTGRDVCTREGGRTERKASPGDLNSQANSTTIRNGYQRTSSGDTPVGCLEVTALRTRGTLSLPELWVTFAGGDSGETW